VLAEASPRVLWVVEFLPNLVGRNPNCGSSDSNLRTANQVDEFFLSVFNDRPEIASDFTCSFQDIQIAIPF
jgi:hypothetical protein